MKLYEKAIVKLRRQLYKFYYKYLRITTKYSKYKYGLNQKKRDIPEIIVSLTSYPKRFADMDLCLKSILNQSYKPDRIIIWLGSDTTKEQAEAFFEKYKKYGIEYFIDKEHNYYSHKKYIYAFDKFKKSIIITFDDDLIYSKNVIKTLIKKYKKYPKNIIARRVHKITWANETIDNYSKWIWECYNERKPSNELCATTGAGTLFPPSIFPKSVIDFNLIRKYALTADDIWLKMMAVNFGIKIVWTGTFLQMPVEINSNKSDSLKSKNVFESKNDIYIKKIVSDFSLTKEKFRCGDLNE